MSSFHELQDLFLLSHGNGSPDDNEFSVLHEELMPKNPDFFDEEYNIFLLEQMSDAECLVRYCLSLRAGSLVWAGYRGQRSWREEWGFAGSRFFVAFDRDTLSKQVSLLAGYNRLCQSNDVLMNQSKDFIIRNCLQ